MSPAAPALALALLLAQAGPHTVSLSVEDSRPVDAMAAALAERYGIAISTEDPAYLWSGDTERVAGVRFPVPRQRRFSVSFRIPADGRAPNAAELAQTLATAANRQFPWAFRVDEAAGVVALIPARTRNAKGVPAAFPPLLDRAVTVPPGYRRIHDSAALFAQELSRQTGFHVSCCQAGVAGYPWGMESAHFGADNESARRVLRRLMAASAGGRPMRYTQRCDPVAPGRPTWCFISVEGVTDPRRAHPLQ